MPPKAARPSIFGHILFQWPAIAQKPTRLHLQQPDQWFRPGISSDNRPGIGWHFDASPIFVIEHRNSQDEAQQVRLQEHGFLVQSSHPGSTD